MPVLSARAVVGRSSAPSFAPDDIAGMLWWHDSVLSTLTMSGADVTSWADLSGNTRP